MTSIRRKSITLANLKERYVIPKELECIDLDFDIPVDDLQWLKFGHISPMGVDLTGVYDPQKEAIYFFDSLFGNSNWMMIFVCRLQLRETNVGASVLYAEFDKNDKNRLHSLFPFERYGFRLVNPNDSDQTTINTHGFELAIRDVVKYAKLSSQPYKSPKSYSKELPPTRIHTSIEKTVTERDFYHLMWGLNGDMLDGRWTAYMEDMTLYWHRTWTGLCCFHIKFKKVEAGYLAYEILSTEQCYKPEMGIELIDDLISRRIYEYEVIAK